MSISPCPPSTPITRGVVVFDPATFKLAFPSFNTLSDPQLQSAFNRATLQLNNTCGSRVCDAVVRETLLDLLTAHIAAITYGENGQPPSGLVGRIDRAQEGSVSVSADMGEMVYGQAYYAQTKYGAEYWAATDWARRMVYVPAPITCADVPGPGGPFAFGFFPGDGGGGCGC